MIIKALLSVSLVLLLGTADSFAAGQPSRDRVSSAELNSDRVTRPAKPAIRRGNQSTAPVAGTGQPIASEHIAVQTGGAPIELHGLSEQALEIPFCRTAEFQFETTGGWGQISGSLEAQRVNNSNSNQAAVSTIGAGNWRIEKIVSGGGAPQNVSSSGFPNAGVEPALQDGPASRTRFRVQLAQGVRPRYYESGFDTGVETHYGRIQLHLRDSNGRKANRTVKVTHKIGPETVTGNAVLQRREYIGTTGYRAEAWFLTGQANYVDCGGGDVPTELLGMEMRSASGKTWTTQDYASRVKGELTKSGVDVRFLVGGRTASPWISVERRRGVLKLDDQDNSRR